MMKILIIAIYVVVLVGLALYCRKNARTVDGFLLGGRKIGTVLSVFSYGATYFSAVIFIGYAGKIGWGWGMSALWIAIGNAVIGSFLAWQFLAAPSRQMSLRLDSVTVPDMLAKRYDSPAMRIISACIIFIFLVPYCSSVYSGLSYLFETIFGIDYTIALVIMAVVTCVYLLLGGFTAMSLIDVVQGAIMLVGAIVMVFFVVNSTEVGGFSNVFSALDEVDPSLTEVVGPGGFINLFGLVMLTSFAPWAMPQMQQRFFAIKDENVIKKAKWGTMVMCGLIGVCAYFTGAMSRLFFTDLSAVNDDVNQIIPTILNATLPDAFAVLILILVLSASMSTLASLVMVSSSAAGIDVIKRLKPNMSEKNTMLVIRVLCVIFVIISLYGALSPGIIVNVMALSWGTVAGSFMAPLIYGLFSKKTTKIGAYAGMITGFSIAVIFSLIYPDSTPLVGTIAMIVPMFVVPIVSKFTKQYSDEHLEKCFGK